MSRPIITAAVVAATVVLIAAVYYLLSPSTTPDGRRITDADRGDAGRETIAELTEQSRDGRVDYDTAYEQAETHREAGRLADAHILYFFAARNGHAASALQLGTMYDPLHHDPATSLLSEPNAFQAYKWYTEALEGGVEQASSRLAALRDWAESEAATSTEAEQLLLQWN